MGRGDSAENQPVVIAAGSANEKPTVPRNIFAVNTVRCAGPNCEAVKGTVNHWYICTIVNGKIFACREFFYPLEEDDRPVCGQECAMKVLQGFFKTGNLVEQKADVTVVAVSRRD
jgi:hypothetical protein